MKAVLRHALKGIAAIGVLVLAVVAYDVIVASEADEALVSPSGRYSVSARPADGGTPETRHCVRLQVARRADGAQYVYQTGASDYQKWAIGWAPNDVVVLYSSDIGTYAYDIADGAIRERKPDQVEGQVGADAYAKRFGHPPRYK